LNDFRIVNPKEQTKNEADETSFRDALYLANDIIRQRNENQYESAEEK
jgi:hypothetical protein